MVLDQNGQSVFIPLLGQEVKKDLLRTYVAIVLDKSGSMDNILDATIQGFNTQVDSIVKEAIGQTFLSLVTFNSYVEPVFWNQHPSYLTKLSRNNYKPQGYTALYDAIGYTINRLDYTAEDVGNAAFLVIIVSDGMENRSQQFRHTLSALMKQKQATGRWTFVYVGSNHDIAKVANDLYIPNSNRHQFTYDAAGTTAAYTASSGGLKSYFADRSVGLTNSTNFFTTTGPVDLNVTGGVMSTTNTVAPAPNTTIIVPNDPNIKVEQTP